jgi:hypothetical protein
MDTTFRILNTFKEFKKIYKTHLSYFDNIDAIYLLTRKTIKSLTLVEAVAFDDESYTQRLQQFLDEEDPTMLNLWKYKLLNSLEYIFSLGKNRGLSLLPNYTLDLFLQKELPNHHLN